jgi:predicted enzyme related to lactoylglutathione lyase
MSETPAEITDVIIDCRNPEIVARFWSSLLKRPVEGKRGPFVWLARSAGGLGLGFQRVEAAKVGKNRVHIDISGPDVTHLKERVESLGGHRVHGFNDGGFLVMADPEGNEFCIVSDSINLDETGRAHYLDGLNL